MNVEEEDEGMMVGEVGDSSRSSIHHLTPAAVIEAIEDYDSEDLEGGETVPTIELTESAALSNLEYQTTAAGNDNNNGHIILQQMDDEDDDIEAQHHHHQQAGSTSITTNALAPDDEPAIAIPLGSMLSTGGMENEFNTNKSSRRFQKRAEFISVNIIKPTKRSDVGLSFSKLIDGGSGLCIADIKKNGILFGSVGGGGTSPMIEVGDRVISINNQSCDELIDPKKATKLLRDAKDSVTIVVQNVGGDPLMVECMITKPTPDHRTGIGFSSSESPPQVNISSVFVEGLFADSLLTEGDEVITVNGIPVRELDSTTVADIVITSPRIVTITAKKFQGNGVVVACDDVDHKKKRKKRRSSSSIDDYDDTFNSSIHEQQRQRRKPISRAGIQVILLGVFLSCAIVIILFAVVAPLLDNR